MLSPNAAQALATVLHEYPELAAVLRPGFTVEALIELTTLPMQPQACERKMRQTSWLQYRRDRKTWAVRWIEPDPTNKYGRRYGWKSFGDGQEGRAKAEEFWREIAPETVRQWQEFMGTTAGTGRAGRLAEVVELIGAPSANGTK